MKIKQRKALMDSIAAWKSKLKAIEIKTYPGFSDKACPCCIEFLGCVGCPIAEYTDDVWCNNTPYNSVLIKAKIDNKTDEDWDELYKAAKNELKFLKEVLKADA